MSDTITIRNKRDAEVEIPDVGVVDAGGTIDVPAELANGIPPSGKEGDPEFRAGTSGLLAQGDMWELATARRKTTDDKPSGEEG